MEPAAAASLETANRKMTTKNRLRMGPETVFMYPFVILVLGDDGAVGAGVAAGTAVQASGSVDHVLIVTLADSTGGANISAGTAADASRSNLISHENTPPFKCVFIVSYNFQKARGNC